MKEKNEHSISLELTVCGLFGLDECGVAFHEETRTQG
jgi:hypothetical protein